jgi:hypothetical protein
MLEIYNIRYIYNYGGNNMKTRRVFLAVFITALIATIVLISLKAYYVAIALIVGVLLIGHREIWSLLRKKETTTN